MSMIMFLSMIVELAEANKKYAFVFLGSPKGSISIKTDILENVALSTFF